MKKFLLLLTLLSLSTFGYSQYNPISQIIYGDGQSRIGYSISINGAGDRVGLVQEGGFPDSNTYVRVYDLIGNDWFQVGEDIQITFNLVNTSSEMVLNQEGNRLVVGTSKFNERHFLKVYEFISNEWVQMGSDIISEYIDDGIGGSLDINAIGNVIVFGGESEDYAKVLKFENNEWIQIGQTVLGDNQGDGFGYSVSINANGNIIAVAAPFNDENGVNAGKIDLYELVNNEWIELGNSIYGQEEDKMGIANGPGNSGVNLTREGTVVSMASFEHQNSQGEIVGMVKVYELLNGFWTQKGQLLEGENINGFFGGSHSMNDSGDILAIGDFYGPLDEKVKVYSFEVDSWSEYASVLPELENFFGFSVAMNDEGNILAVGAPDDGGSQPSEARLYEYNGVLEVSDNAPKEVFLLYPNPNNGRFSLDFSKEIDVTSVTVVDALGRTVYSETNIPRGTFEIDQNFRSGVYFVNMSSTSSETTLKMIVE